MLNSTNGLQVVHSYYTAGMHPLAKTFVESFSIFHSGVLLFIDAIGISEEQKQELLRLYDNIKVNVKPYPYSTWAVMCGVPTTVLRDWQEQIEKGYVTEETRVWKLLTAGDHRVQHVWRAVINNALIGSPSHAPILLHFDIDTLFRANITKLTQLVANYDVGLKLRPKIKPVKARITIDVMALRSTKNTLWWMSKWLEIIRHTPPMERPIGFGQSSCWEAYAWAEKTCRLNALTLPLTYGLPGRNRPGNLIWCGNIHKLRKVDCATVFAEEIKRLKGTEHE